MYQVMVMSNYTGLTHTWQLVSFGEVRQGGLPAVIAVTRTHQHKCLGKILNEAEIYTIKCATFKVMVTHCVCKDDGCNASSSLVPFYTLVLTIVTAVTFIGRNILA